MRKYIKKGKSFIEKGVKIGKNVVIYEGNHIEGRTIIGDNVTLLPGNYIKDSTVENGVRLHNSVVEQSLIKCDSEIGPFARLRPASHIGQKCKIGNFVEIKNSNVGDGTKISHLAYVGDCDIGKNCNIGCGVIFANYDGKKKHRTRVGDHVFVGSNSNIIAPVEIKDNSYICAGTTVTRDVAEKDMVIGRVRQENKPNRAEEYW